MVTQFLIYALISLTIAGVVAAFELATGKELDDVGQLLQQIDK